MIEGQIGRFKILEELGHGAFGTVYRALDTTLNVERAIKILNPVLLTEQRIVDDFYREAQVVARLRHPNIVQVHDVLNEEGRLSIVMDYMPGGSLADKLAKQGPLTLAQSMPILRQIADALTYAHDKGMVHCDIKPQNILFDENGVAHLSDFGLARTNSSSSNSMLMSHTGNQLGGTWAYMAPELFDNAQPTSSSDIYAWACVIYEILTSKVLFSANSTGAVVKQHLKGVFLEEITDQKVRKILINALNIDPSKRLDIKEIVNQLESIASFDDSTTQNSPIDLGSGSIFASIFTSKANRKWLGIAGIVMMAICAFAIGRAIQPPIYQTTSETTRLPQSNPAPTPKQVVTALVSVVEGSVRVKETVISPITITVRVPETVLVNQTVQVKETVEIPIKIPVTQTVLVKEVVPVKETLISPITVQVRETVQVKERIEIPVTVQVPVIVTKTIEVQSQAQSKVIQEQINSIIDLTGEKRKMASSFFEMSKLLSNTKATGPFSGTLNHLNNNLVTTYHSGADYQNFVLSVKFDNPYSGLDGAWDFGVGFRSLGANDQYRLAIRSNKAWEIRWGNEMTGTIAAGKIDQLDLSSTGANTLKLIVYRDKGWFFVNDFYIDDFRLNKPYTNKNEIFIGTVFNDIDKRLGAKTKFSDLVVSLLP